MDKKISLRGIDQLILLGSHDENLHLIESAFPSKMVIRGDDIVLSGESNDVGQNVPSVLVNQLDELPDEIASCAEIYTDKGLILVSLPLSNGCRVCVTYNVKKLLPKIHSVHFVRPHTKVSVDVTNDVLTNNYASLNLIHKHAEEKVTGDKRKYAL